MADDNKPARVLRNARTGKVITRNADAPAPVDEHGKPLPQTGKWW